MSIRIGNTVYIDGMNPVEVEPQVAEQFDWISAQYEITKDGLDDLIANKPGGVVRVKPLKREGWPS